MTTADKMNTIISKLQKLYQEVQNEKSVFVFEEDDTTMEEPVEDEIRTILDKFVNYQYRYNNETKEKKV
jgi:hypothetical protein